MVPKCPKYVRKSYYINHGFYVYSQLKGSITELVGHKRVDLGGGYHFGECSGDGR